jgi:hypothetical protein
MARFLNVGFVQPIGPEQRQALEIVLNEATDWLRYSSLSYLLWTSQSPQVWTDKIRATPGMESHSFLIAPIDMGEKWGIQQKWIWEWIEKSR